MRVVLVGAGSQSVMTARLLIDQGHEVVVIDRNRERIDSLIDQLDCSFIHGDGGSPEILREADPTATDAMFCLTDNDQVNIIAGLVGRSLGFKRVITSIQNPDYERICNELGMDDTIIPVRTVSRYLADMLVGVNYLELRTVVKAEARLFSFTAQKDDAGQCSELNLPNNSRVVWVYRDGHFQLCDEDSSLKAGDEVVIATHSENLPELRDRWQPGAIASNSSLDRR